MSFFRRKKKEETTSAVPVLPQDIYETGALELRDIIAPSALRIASRHIEIGEKFARTFYIMQYPRILQEGWFAPIVNLDRVFDISIFIHPTNTAKVLRDLQKKITEIESQINIAAERGLVRDPKLDTAYQDVERLRDQLQRSQERLFDVGVYITIYGGNEDELDKVETELRGILESKLILVRPALFQQDAGFHSTSPLGSDRLVVHTKLNTSPLSSIFPFISFDLTQGQGILYGINRHNSSLVLFDRYSLENYNSVIFAKSGSGKSIRGNEPVLVRENGIVRLEDIGPLVERIIKKRGCEQIDEELEGVIKPNIEVYSFNKMLCGEWSSVSVAARKKAPAEWYIFKTKSGREITTTADHNMLVVRDGRVTSAKSADVQTGECVPLPRRVSLAEEPITYLDLLDLFKNSPRIYVAGAGCLMATYRKTLRQKPIDIRLDRYAYRYAAGRRMPIAYFHKLRERLGTPNVGNLTITSASGNAMLPARLELTPALGTLLGYIASEGTSTNGAIIISNTDAGVLRQLEEAFEDLGVSYYHINGAIATGNRTFIELVRALGAWGTSKTKRVPPIFYSAPQPMVAAFIRAYFEGDGGVDGAAITAVSRSRMLISDISYLLLSFGIIARIHARRKVYAATGRRRTFWHLSISGSDLRRFHEQIGFATARKNDLLAAVTNGPENTNVDVIPGIVSLAHELDSVLGPHISDISDFSQLKQGRGLSPKRLLRLTETLFARVEQYRELAPAMQQLADLPTIEGVVSVAQTNKDLNRKLIGVLGSSWFTVKRGMSPRTHNALAIFAAAGIDAPETTGQLKSLITSGVNESRLAMDAIDQNPSLTLRGDRDNSSYEMLRGAGAFIAREYARILSLLPRAEECIGLMRNLARGELFFDPIVSIECAPNTTDHHVYDLTVDNEVFLAGKNGMFVHNSYMTKLEILRSLMFDTEVIVIDPENEYEYLAEAVGGRYFNISLTSEHHINPFDLPAVREDESPADVLRGNIITLVGLIRIMLGGLTAEEDAIIDRAITETYALKDITGDQDFADREAPLLSDLELVLAGMEGGGSLAQRLAKYTQGTWSGFINRPTNVDINKKFIAFSVRDMQDELKPVAMHIVTHHIWNAVRFHLRKRLLVIDEAWWMFRSDDTASFLFSIAKRGRKYYLGLATITQDVEDFLRSPYGIPLITNSSLQILFKQSPAAIDVLQQTFNLTNEEKYLLLESQVGEGIFFAGLKHVAIKVVGSYTENQIITSDPSQLLAIRRAKQDLKAAGGAQPAAQHG